MKFVMSLKRLDPTLEKPDTTQEFRRIQRELITQYCDCKPDSDGVCKALLEFLK